MIEAVFLFLFSQQDDRHRAVIVFGATIVAGTFALYSYLHRIQESKLVEAGKIMKRWNAPELFVGRTTLGEIAEGLLDIFNIARQQRGQVFTKEGYAVRMQVISMLNFYEELAVGISEKSIDDDRSRRFFYSMASQAYEYLEHWIKNERNIDHAQSLLY